MNKQFLFSLLIIAASFTISAQKIAHLDFDSLISLMPESKVASEAANNYLKGLEEELVYMQSEFDNKYKDFTEKQEGMSELAKKNKQQDLQQLQARIQDFRGKAEQDFRVKQAEIGAPIIAKAKSAIAAVAKENGYRYVLDNTQERTSILYSEASDDILMMVKKKLDTMPLAPIPGAPALAPVPTVNPPATTKPTPKAK
jgi:outer membrane protein